MWQPVVAGELAEAARRTILDIARTVVDETDPQRIPHRALFWAYVAGTFDDDWIAAAYDTALAALGEHAGHRMRDLSLYHGVAATGFAIAHVSEPGAADDSLQVFDDIIATTLAGGRWPGHFDLISGLAGIAVYALERGPAGVPLLEHIVAQLATRGETLPTGTAWHTSVDMMPPQHHAKWPRGYFNAGVAHGTPGVAAVLGRIVEHVPTARPLAEAALAWTHHVRSAAGVPAWITRDDGFETSRTAWCYGDPGVAIAEWSCAARLGLPVVDARAHALAATRLGRADTGVVDAGLCHGAVGLAHLFNRCFQASGDFAFRDAACAWFARTLAMKQPDGRYIAWSIGASGELEWRHSTTFLEGPIGIALALLAAITDSEPNWDRLLLCDLP